MNLKNLQLQTVESKIENSENVILSFFKGFFVDESEIQRAQYDNETGTMKGLKTVEKIIEN